MNPRSEAALAVLVALTALAVIAAGAAFLALNGWMVPS